MFGLVAAALFARVLLLEKIQRLVQEGRKKYFCKCSGSRESMQGDKIFMRK